MNASTLSSSTSMFDDEDLFGDMSQNILYAQSTRMRDA